jgi:hypothetical protein
VVVVALARPEIGSAPRCTRVECLRAAPDAARTESIAEFDQGVPNMKRVIVPMGAALAAFGAGSALAKPPTRAHARTYEHAYKQVARKFGPRTPGRNILRDGTAKGRAATDAETMSSLAVLDRMLAPPPTVTSSTSTVSYAGSSGASGVPVCASESGTNYSTDASNTNASSGATGRYQIVPSTAAAYGCDLSTPSGQDACAATIYEHQGASAWVGCGG